MEQAFSHFNSGKYKEAFNQLNSTFLNMESYQPNLMVCEYLGNRSIQSSQQCIRKLSQLLAKKSKKDNDHYERLTEQLIKYNLGILMAMNGKKENAFILLNDIYHNEKCFIDYLKYRMLLLLMELNICLKSSVKAINLAGKYINNPYENRNSTSQWISSVFHEHSKAYSCLKEELEFMVSIFLSQAMMQLGVSDGFLLPNEDREERKNSVLEKAKKRKNNINKYYEINLLMIDRFYEAQKEFHQNNIEKSIKLLHFPTIQTEYEQMPQTKIITNIYSAFSNNNIGIVNFSKGKKTIALHFLNKAHTLLLKGCTGVEDKDLQLFSSNYAHHSSRIAFNLGLLSLSLKAPNSYSIFQALKKAHNQKIDFKYWYRMGQSELEHYHQNYERMNMEQRKNILENAYKSFSNSLTCLSKRQVPDLSMSQIFSNQEILKEDEIQTIIMKMNGQTEMFKQNITLLICYVSLALKRYYRVIFLAKEVLKNEKSSDPSKLYACHYLSESYMKLDRIKEAGKYVREGQKLSKSMKKQRIKVFYERKNKLVQEEADIENISFQQSVHLKAKQGQSQQALGMLQKEKGRNKIKISESMNMSLKYLEYKGKVGDNKYS